MPTISGNTDDAIPPTTQLLCFSAVLSFEVAIILKLAHLHRSMKVFLQGYLMTLLCYTRIRISRSNMEDAVLDPTTESGVFQSRSSYFEAVRHCMVGLQHVASAHISLDKYLVSLDKVTWRQKTFRSKAPTTINR
ncbi:hypothetical protein F4679DRAFT_127314 [Xylaria curta]|nr:hypothetical protein F4679DRAFT_127314 [Xylaria curta]